VEGTGSPQEWVEIANFTGVSALQVHLGLHGEFESSFIKELAAATSSSGKELFVVLPALLISNLSDVFRARIGQEKLLDAIFLDSGTATQPGGTGRVFDWQKAVPVVTTLSKNANVVVSGGLTPDNVGDAIRILKPWGVDVVSGVEVTPGKKDPAKVRAFIHAVRLTTKIPRNG
jgi:phosphoribosylanthranilate isomerase